MGIEMTSESWQILAVFLGYIVGVLALGVLSHKFLKRGSFVSEYFLGNRGLGAWVLALTVAATAVSGGSFMGFPSLIYTNGWVMALWISSYMVVALTVMLFLGKRINQVARVTGAVTVPDVLRDRFNSPALGLTATLLILLFLTFNLVAQFKAGGLVMKEAMQLRPPPAEFVGATVNEDHFLEIRFAGHEKPFFTPLPTKTAEYLPERTEVDQETRRVKVYFAEGEDILHKYVRFPAATVSVPLLGWEIEKGYLIGLILFAITVIGYTTYGGFWAVTWNDVLQGMVMLGGVLIMAVLAVRAVVPVESTGATGLNAATERLMAQDPALVYGPGPADFLPFGLAFSFFLMWSLNSPGQPSGMVRMMSFKDSRSLRRALVLVAIYYLLTYLAMMVIFTSARTIFPNQYLREIGSEGEPDSIMPAMARHLAGSPLLAGILLAAPYAAIMSTVAAFLLMISSSLVRDIYQRSINPNVSQRTMKVLSYTMTALIGVVVMIGAMNPPTFLQYIIVFTGTGQGSAFLIPMLLALYWRRATRWGVLAGMLAGALTVIGMYALGWMDNFTQSNPNHWLQQVFGWLPDWGRVRGDKFAPLAPGGFDPLVWGFSASLLAGLIVSWCGRPDPNQVNRYFPAKP